jgi:hypothetical protein
MSNILKPHPLASLFPELPPEELAELARDIKKRGQLEPIILHKGFILDGRNRYRACQIAGVKPQIEEFNPEATNRSPSEFVLSRNLRRRHLSVGQKAAIALEWSEQIELSADPEKNAGRGRPKGTLTEVAKNIGINERRVFEVRQIREAKPALYRKVKAGSRSLNSALAEISPSRETRSYKFDLDDSESIFQERDWGGGNARPKASGWGPLIAQPIGGKAGRGVHKPTDKDTSASVKPPPSRIATEKALVRIRKILGSWFYGEVKGRNLIQKTEEIVQFAKLTDAQMREIGSLLKRGWTFSVAFQEVIERLTPDDEIRALHTRAVANGGNWYFSSVGSFEHFVAWGPEKDKILAKLKDALARLSVPH